MKKSLLILTLFFCLVNQADANHIKGGFFSYKYLGPGSNPANNAYSVTLTVYMLCDPNSGQLNNPINFTIYNTETRQFVNDISVPIANQYKLFKGTDEPCISGDQTGCYYEIVIYDLPSIELPRIPGGYTISYQRCCRIAGIQNLVPPSANIGNTFTISIPGTFTGYDKNSSPQFLINDTAVVCGGSYFEYSFLASDPDGDSLRYEFCDAYAGASSGASAPATASPPPYVGVPYAAPFAGFEPMGNGVTINSSTGLISGVAPNATGEYVLCVCVRSYDRATGEQISITRKELHVRVGDCEPIEARLDPQYITCDGFTMTFQNRAPASPLVTSYFWDFGVLTALDDTSNLEMPTFTYPDTGVYIVKLVVNRNQQCTDSTTTIVKVYPGFFPKFGVTGACFTNPFNFHDSTLTTYGVVNSWSWNFGDLSTLADTSHAQHPTWTYPNSGDKEVTLIVSNSKGCVKTIKDTITVIDKPVLTLAFKDALICRPDSIQLDATGIGNFTWTPGTNIINPTSPDPIVFPPASTTYYVELNDNGCINNDSVRVNVVGFVTLNALADTVICRGDIAQLGAVSDGLTFSWTPIGNISDPTIINPTAVTTDPTMYYIYATIGTCNATDSMFVNTVPYPTADAGESPVICYNKSGQLNATIVGNSFTWSPTSYLNDPTILNPISTPPRTTEYVLTVYDTRNCPNCCPKPSYDTVTVTVLPKIRPFAGRDTSVIVGQPLQFNASGGVRYLWSPPSYLSDPGIYNPVGTYDREIDSLRYKVVVYDESNCEDSAFIIVRVFKTKPSVFVPTAFTPNKDGRNDVIRPIAVGIERINYFSIYNRWGQLVFTTSENGKGWDGNIGGKPQGSGVYVWMVNAVDYLGNKYFDKGTVTLIR